MNPRPPSDAPSRTASRPQSLAARVLPAPPRSRGPLLARLLSPPGPPKAGVWQKGGAEVMAVPGRYSVTYLLLGSDGVAVVDVGSRADISGILDALNWLGRSLSEVRYVLPTHLHFDHVMGIDALARRLSVPVALGQAAHQHVTTGRSLRWPRPVHMLRAIPTWLMQGMPFPPLDDYRHGLDFGFPWGRNRFTAELGPVLHHRADLPDFPGWTVLYTPGHADDAICLHHAESGFLVSGDTIRNFLGGEWNPLRCSYPDFDLSRRLLLSLPVETVFPAHGPVVQGPDILHGLPTPAPWMP